MLKMRAITLLGCFLVTRTIYCAPSGISEAAIHALTTFWEVDLPSNGEVAAWAEGGDKFEGDMVLSAAQRRLVAAAAEGKLARNGLRGVTKRWPDNLVVYHIEEDDFDAEQIELIVAALQDISNHSCVRFRPRGDAGEHAVRIQGSASGCFSSVGFQSPPSESAGEESGGEEESPQVLNLSRGCFRHGTVVHEMLHTLGFYHMQSTFDRDDYVIIHWDNILPGTEHNFAKYTNDTVTDFGVSYDYGSVMHYPATAFSSNGNVTIEPQQKDAELGQREGMSEKDIVKLKRMYCEKSIDNKINHSF